MRRDPNELLRGPGTGWGRRRDSGGGSVQWLRARSMRILSSVEPRQIRGRQIDLARRDFQRLAGVLFVAHVEFDRLPAGGGVHDHLPRSQRRRQRNADHRHPGRTVLDHQGAVSVGVHIGQGRAAGIEAQDLDAARHGILVRQTRGRRQRRILRQEQCARDQQEQGARDTERAAHAHEGEGAAGRSRGAGRHAAHHEAPSTLARTLPRASRASMRVPGFASAALRRMSPPSRLTMA